MSVLVGGRAREIWHVRCGTAPRARRVEPVRPPSRPPLVTVRGRVRVLGRCEVRPSAPPRWLWLVALAVAVAAVVAGLGLLAGALTRGVVEVGTENAPPRTTVVAVAPGDTLTGVAARYTSGGELSAVVEHIKRLNGLSGAEVSAGMPLVVPVWE
ncbi:hypothetical protein FHU38_001592 [Saccharomonospora amisosensis]|uniref:LysM domain-containing protein n=1 Tax=Saccharomonospora amisosensis TaxID=1128677 RepID=A0A7X5UP84_9PSEU|nr:LysM peptidoglycan-binding domain-containing protein [Saccharomonospora amisosensis]NIJ11248.1 hypothetical protein [Saccharomonospora amisosensis]